MREAAARAQCTNNLKQLALAIQNYHDFNGELPCGTIQQPGLAPDERLSWIVALLPYLEEQRLSEQFDRNTGWAAEKNQRAAAMPIKMLKCPAQPMQESASPWPFTSYVGMAGVGADAASLPLKDRRCGTFGNERRITFKDVKDGTSRTLGVIETTTDNGRWAAGGRATLRGLEPEQTPWIGVNRPFGMDHSQPFLGSLKFADLPFGANAAMLDGSVRALSASIHPSTLAALATIAGNEEIGADF